MKLKPCLDYKHLHRLSILIDFKFVADIFLLGPQKNGWVMKHYYMFERSSTVVEKSWKNSLSEYYNSYFQIFWWIIFKSVFEIISCQRSMGRGWRVNVLIQWQTYIEYICFARFWMWCSHTIVSLPSWFLLRRLAFFHISYLRQQHHRKSLDFWKFY